MRSFLGRRGRYSLTDDLILPKTAGKGVRVDNLDPSFGWRDLEGPIDPKETGAGKPTYAVFRGNIKAYWFAANDVNDLRFHWPHDWLPESDAHIHLHWAHNGTTISGSIVMDYRWSYAKGHNQGAFPAESTLTQTVSTPDVATYPQYQHVISEVQLSAASPAAGQVDTDDLEPDGLLMISMTPTTIPTIGGGGNFFIHYVDIHYQSTNIGTKAKAPDFYT